MKEQGGYKHQRQVKRVGRGLEQHRGRFLEGQGVGFTGITERPQTDCALQVLRYVSRVTVSRLPLPPPASAAGATGAGGSSSGGASGWRSRLQTPSSSPGRPGPTSSVLCLSVSEPRVKVRRIKGPSDGPRDRILEPLLYSHCGLENLVSPPEKYRC